MACSECISLLRDIDIDYDDIKTKTIEKSYIVDLLEDMLRQIHFDNTTKGSISYEILDDGTFKCKHVIYGEIICK